MEPLLRSAVRNASLPSWVAPRWAHRLLARLLVLLMAALGFGVGISPAGADDVAGPPCADLTVVFVRGSGQELMSDTGHQGMAQSYFDHVETHLAGYSLNRYELGSQARGGFRYRAVGISWAFDLDRSDIIKIVMSLISLILGQEGSGQPSESGAGLLEIDDLAGLEYRDSVTDGVGEFLAYLQDRGSECPEELFLVGGFSQGAQVTRQGLFLLDQGIRDRIVHVALFSDPTLYLPEGESPALVDGCQQGVMVSPWRRGSVGCSTSNGLLNVDGLTFLRTGPHLPYLPSDMETRVGSWCEESDGVCTGSLLDLLLGMRFDVETRRFRVPIHGVYTDKYFGEAGREAASLVVAISSERGGQPPSGDDRRSMSDQPEAGLVAQTETDWFPWL